MDAEGIREEAAGRASSSGSPTGNCGRFSFGWIFHCCGPAGTWKSSGSAAELSCLYWYTSSLLDSPFRAPRLFWGGDFLDGEGTAWFNDGDDACGND